MGLRENFTQAVKELAGGKDDSSRHSADKKGVQVEDLKRAVNEESPDIREDFAPFESGEESTEKNDSHISEELKLGKTELAEKKIETVTDESANSEGSTYHSVSQAAQTAQASQNTQNVQNMQNVQQAQPAQYSQSVQPAQSAPSVQFSQPAFNPPPVQPSPAFNNINNAPPPFAQQNMYQQSVPPAQNTHNSRVFPNISANSAQQNYLGGYAANSGYSGYQDNRNNIWDKPYYSSYQPSTPNYSDAEITVISKNTVIDGNIRSFANMSIDGDIKGDVETTKNIDVNGKIVGNITCNNAEMHTSQIQGNIRMKGNVIMERDTLLIGDLVSTYAKVNGKIKGNLDIVGKAELKSDAVVFGDISASTITVDDGAIIQGYVSTTFLNKEESRNIFPDAISIGEAINNS